MTVVELALFISALAFLVSLASLWVNSLKPFKLKLSHDAPTFRLYKITPQISGDEKGKCWWIPSFDLGVSFYNIGKCPGEVLDIRLVGELVGHRSHRKFVFYPKWIVDYSIFQKHGSNRFAWLESAILRDWYPVTLGANDEKNLHIVLESGRWDHKEDGEMALTLEIFSSQSKAWHRCAKYHLPVRDDMFEDNSSYTPYDEKLEKLRKMEA